MGNNNSFKKSFIITTEVSIKPYDKDNFISLSDFEISKEFNYYKVYSN